MCTRLLILYGSQTGQAQAIAEHIYQTCCDELSSLRSADGLLIDCLCLDKTEQKFSLEKESTVVFVVSTTGEGEPPDNAIKFYRRIKKRTLANTFLSHLSYCLLALGDSNYDRFANFGRDLDKRLQQLGAKRFYETGFGDDAVGLEVGVEPWCDSLLPAILTHFNAFTVLQVNKVTVNSLLDNREMMHSLLVSKPPLAELNQLTLPLISSKFKEFKIILHEVLPDNFADDAKTFYFDKLAVMDSPIIDTNIVSIKQLTQSTSDDNEVNDHKIVLEATIKIDSNECPPYVPGDSFGFILGNHEEEVDTILRCLDLKEKADSYCEILTPGLFSHFPRICKIRDLIKYYLEIRSVPKKNCLRHFSDFCTDEAHKRRLLELSSREGTDDFAKFIRNPSVSILDILKVFTSCKPTLEVLLANVPCFTPRYYSVANAPSVESKDVFKIAFSVINLPPVNERSGSQLNGVFTGFMYQKYREENKIENKLKNLSISNMNHVPSMKAFKRKNPHFKLPAVANIPLILIGPGTGVAPFIGFLQQRQQMRNQRSIPLGETWLFFGCRNSKVDYIYRNELEEFLKDNVLTQLCVCFSREETTDESKPKYVQDLLLEHSSQVYKLIDSKKAHVYVCGDVKMMSVNVFNTFVKIVEDSGRLNHENSVQYIRSMQNDKRYLQDVWI